MNIQYMAAFCFAFGLSLWLTRLVRSYALRAGWVDVPEARKMHTKPIPRVGGIAITIAFVLPMLAYLPIDRKLAGLLGGVAILFAVGLADDLKRLAPWTKLIWQIVAVGVVLAGGIGIVFLTNPLGGILHLDHWQIAMHIGNFHFNVIPIANAVSFIWVLGMINAVNLLDGLDGLAGGISAIAALVLFILAASPGSLANPVVAVLSIILLGALLGFLPYNFYPSSIFMGDSGAYVIGLVLALLSIYSGSKIAIGALILGFAVIDMIWAVLRRILGKRSPFAPDRSHLHHRLVDSGVFSHRRAVLVLYVMALAVGVGIFAAGALAGFAILVLALIVIISVLRILGPIQTRRL